MRRSDEVPGNATVVLRDQLPLPRPFVSPRTPTQRTLAEIWRTVLNMDCVGIEDSYHDLGGDSFMAAVIFAMIKESFALEIPMAVLARSPTVEAMAREIDSLLRA